MEYIKIGEVRNDGSEIRISFEASDCLRQYFNDFEFFAIYNSNVSDVPESVAVIPLIASLLPLIWITDSKLIVKELDKDFHESIPKFKKGYIDMYPMLSFRGNIDLGEIISNDRKLPDAEKKCGAFFSGGVDAWTTLISHIDEKPDLITVRGADIRTYDDETWKIVSTNNKTAASELNLSIRSIESNFTEIFNQCQLNDLVQESQDNWWHGFQHGLGLISLVAPLAYSLGYSVLYIASSYTKNDKATCASDPSIDNHVRFCGCQTIHDGYELTRQQKIRLICSHSQNLNKPPFLRVCYMTKGGKNCCQCEKCLRTAVGIFVAGYDPEKFGFKNIKQLNVSKINIASMVNPSAIPFWDDIAAEIRKWDYTDIPKNLRWLKNANLNMERIKLSTRLYRCLKRKLN